jgi:hypothetical protein
MYNDNHELIAVGKINKPIKKSFTSEGLFSVTVKYQGQQMITLPIEIGDTVLGGRFKNKKIIVREIGTDEHGSPTINGRSILKVRMPKLYMKENTMIEEKLEKIVRKVINEMRQLKEVDVTDNETLEVKAKRYAKLANKMKVLEYELKTFETEYGELDDEFRNLVEATGKTKDTFIKAGKILIKIERAGYERDAPKWKTGFEWLHSRVNGVMKELADEAMDLVKGVAKVKSKISVVFTEQSSLNEGVLSKLKNWFMSLTTKIFKTTNTANKVLDVLEQKFK